MPAAGTVVPNLSLTKSVAAAASKAIGGTEPVGFNSCSFVAVRDWSPPPPKFDPRPPLAECLLLGFLPHVHYP